MKKLLDEAQRIAPKSDEELHEKLQADDLPTELPVLEEELDEAETKVRVLFQGYS